jgi:hypothetical protein
MQSKKCRNWLKLVRIKFKLSRQTNTTKLAFIFRAWLTSTLCFLWLKFHAPVWHINPLIDLFCNTGGAFCRNHSLYESRSASTLDRSFSDDAKSPSAFSNGNNKLLQHSISVSALLILLLLFISCGRLHCLSRNYDIIYLLYDSFLRHCVDNGCEDV